MRKTTKITIVGTSVAALMGAGIAYAAWTSTGTGSGTASSATDQGLTVSAAPVSGLYPTGSQDQAVTVTNNNDYPVTLDSLTSSVSTDDANVCKVSSTIVGTPNARLAAGAQTTYTFTVAMGPDSADSCKSSIFTIGYDSSAHSTN